MHHCVSFTYAKAFYDIEKRETSLELFPLNSSVSYHQKFVSIIFFLVLSVSAMYGFIVS